MVVTNWHGLYKKGWNGNLVPEAFSHPAKVSFGLAERIYQHMADEGWLEPGAVVVDPFGGIAGCAFHAMRHGCNWIGVELEEKFVTLGGQNIELWLQRYSRMPGWGTARLVQGDSRKLLEVIAEAGAVVSSPPYADALNTDSNGIDWEKAKKDYPGRTNHEKRIAMHNRHANNMHYADRTPGNLGNMRGTPQGLSAAVSSPPYAESLESPKSGIDWDKAHGSRWSIDDDLRYGSSPGQLGAMPAKGFDAAISSPPYAETAVAKSSDGVDLHKQYETYRAQGGGQSYEAFCETQRRHSGDYGSSPGQLGAMPARGFEASVRTVDKSANAVYNPWHERKLSTPQNQTPSTDGTDTRDVSIGLDFLPDSRAISNFTGDDTETIERGRGNQDRNGSAKTRNQTGTPDPAPLLGGKETTRRNGSKANGENQRPESLGVEGRQGTQRIPQSGSERNLRDLREPPEPSGTSQGFRPLQQRPGELTGSLRELSSEPTQETILGSGEEWRDTAQEQRPDWMEIDDFWVSARLIVDQVYAALAPGGHAVWIVKHFVKNKKRVDFPGQWKAMCEAAGFVTVHEHRAWLIEDRGTQIDLEGKHHAKKVERKSFFRRLAENKGSPRIDWETVYCMVKPE